MLMGLYFGSSLKFYDKYFWWDILVHFLAGVSFVSLGIALVRTIANLNSFQVIFFSLTLATFIHTIWEIVEYLVDRFSHTDHQRWQKKSTSKNHLSKSAVQPAGLVDTMHDTIAGISGAVIACIVWWFVL